ncbi:MAG: hypothetical protein WBN89_13555 [Prochlorococcaceae cyanobacterium]
MNQPPELPYSTPQLTTFGAVRDLTAAITLAAELENPGVPANANLKKRRA